VKWEDFLKRKGNKEYRVIPMDGAYKGHVDLKHKPAFPGIKLSREVPDPDGMSIIKYRKVAGIPAYDLLSDNSGMLHVGYLTEDCGLLSSCLRFGVEYWGQIKGFNYSGLIQGLDEATIEMMKIKVQLLEDFQALYRHGRSRKVDMDILIDSGAINDTFKKEVKEKLELAGGDPVKLINDMPSGFRKRNRELLETYLIEKGYIHEGKPSTLKEIEPKIQLSAVQLGIGAKEAEDFINGIIGIKSGDTE
jgi:hypothetical protein